jgi:predicted membrane channel-forming protein YqfA (hemolysin III family)
MFVIIYIVFVLCFAGFVLQSSLLKRYLIIGYALVSAIFLWFSHTYAINESYTSIKAMLTNQNLMYTLSVIVTIEAVIGILVNLSIIKRSRTDRFKLMKYMPSVSWFITIYFAQILLFLNIPGINFKLLAVCSVALIGGLYLISALFLSREKEQQFALELKFVVHLLQILVAGVISVIYSSSPYNGNAMHTDLIPLAVFIGVSVPVMIIGILLRKREVKRLTKYMNT